MAAHKLGRRLSVGLAVASLLLATAVTAPADATTPSPIAYHVSGNRIVDSADNPFIVKGVDAVYGRFAGGDVAGYGLRNYQNAQRDLDNLKAQNVNLIRVMVSYSQYTSGPLGSAEYLTELDQVVLWVTQRGMVVELSQGWAGGPANVVTYVDLLGRRYSSNPLVWIKPDNEPSCNDGDISKCTDWSYWQNTEQQYVQAIRRAGNTQPIVINCVGWSWDCSQIASYPLGDSNLIYGSHWYGLGRAVFDAQQAGWCDRFWAGLASRYAMVVDEVGLQSDPNAAHISPADWGAGFLDYATTWVKTRQGSGVIGFSDSWSDQNSMTNPDGTWNAWGQAFIGHYLSK